ncbi:deoxycytidylate deaminase [Streptobacillus moniliformis]|uniref:CMP/dCMP deaminase zinc-binding protein n=1 Tax=Streptobacillus moniliformis (strain ATCC 14647 / DSM 12112 / NCTC 10651 / 9901) TaxID=519441 RepID=D1AYK8_STRM9|nr:dCMP deaminase family protein [Streptobacillus moniliformis]ACZ01384.1 CMP/dCMP deaminase zinc-binding protein [Streptobacillus moniliformis DSM 12112]AVL43603.1 cytidine deaminase [Streptobacillus moniliformis]QXW66071.1 dCMP deaminase family protein [Streptobacillus moniliformis]SQA13456.1 tRNA-specific adenosine deaminase [Streptobacillus moniliformis]
MKRTTFLSWDEYFMGIAFLSANRSKDPVTQVGACIVKDSKIVGIGYNGFPIGSSDDEVPWEKDGDFLNTKYAYVVHAELNAILNSNRDLKGSTIYVTHFPCNECAKSIIQTGISKVIFFSDKHKDKDSSIASKRMLSNAGIEIVKLELEIDELIIKFKD